MTIYFLRCTHPRYMKCLFTNTRKQWNMLKSSLLFKKNTNLRVNNSRILRIKNVLVLLRYCFHLENVLKTSLQDVLTTSRRCLEDVFARRLQDFLKTYDQDEYSGLDQGAFWRRLTNTFEYISLDQDVLKASSLRQMFAKFFLHHSHLLQLVK